MMRAAATTVFLGANPGREQRPRSGVLQGNQKDLLPVEWQKMTAFARQLFVQLGEVRGPILEKATYVVGDGWTPQFYGSDRAWGEKAEAWLWEWMKIADVRGDPFDFHSDLFIGSISLDRCGDFGIVLTETGDSYPQIQFLPSHRIGNRNSQTFIADGPYRGLKAYNGVIFNEFGRAVAYQVKGEDASGKQDRTISARDMMLVFDPEWYDQGRGITALAHAIIKLMDLQDIHDATLAGIKAAASIALQEWNDSGAVNSGRNRTATTNSNGSGITVEEIDRGLIKYFKANSGNKLEVLRDERPSQNSSEFLEKILRAAYQGIEWPYEFTRDMSKIGGAPARIMLAKAGRTVRKRQRILKKPATRIVGYALSKAIKNKSLTLSNEWWMWNWQMPPIITADAGREAQQDREDLKAGTRSLAEDAAERGVDWQELRNQVEKEAEDILIRAKRLAQRFDISMEAAMNLLQQRTPNGNQAPVQNQESNSNQNQP